MRRSKAVLHFLMLAMFFTISMSCTKEETTPTAKLPDIQTFEPMEGVPGDVVTIAGKDLGTAGFSTVVKFGPVEAVVQSASETSITVVVPHVVAEAKIIVLAGDQRGVSSDYFTILPFITSIEPSHATVGTNIEIHGGGFPLLFNNCQVFFNGVLGAIDCSSINEGLTENLFCATVPAGATTGLITVHVSTTPGAGTKTATSPMEFVVD